MANGDYMTESACNRLRIECPTRAAVYEKDGVKDQMSKIQEKLEKIDKRLTRIEYVGMGIAAAYVFFSQVLPTLIRMGQAAAATP